MSIGSRTLWRLVVATLLLLTPSEAAAHGVLRSSSPAEGDRLDRVPTALRLEFNEPIDLDFARLMLIAPDGAPVRLGGLAHAADSAQVVVSEILGTLRPGEYTVQWQVTGVDGHPVRGEYAFVLEDDAAGLTVEAADAGPLAPGAASPPAEHHPVADDMPAFDAESPLYAAVRWLNFLGLVMLIGAGCFALILLPRVTEGGRSLAEGAVDLARSRTAGLGLLAAGILCFALILRLYAQSVALHGPDAALAADRLLMMLSRTVWGWGWTVQAVATVAAVAGLLLARRGVRAGWPVTGVAILVLSTTPALSGHAAASSPLAVAADAAHVLAAGGWLGTLLVMVVVGLPVLVRGAASRSSAAAGLLNVFSPLALGFAGILTLTGIYSAWIHLPDLASLWTSDYGRTLLLKLGALSLLIAAGAYNWLRVKPAISEDGDVSPLRRSAAAELTVGVVVLAITAVLVATPPPRSESASEVAARPTLTRGAP